MESQEFFKYLPELETEHLRLRKLTLDDEEDLFKYAKDAEVAKYLSWEPHRHSAESLFYIQIVIGQYNQNFPSPWALVDKQTNAVIGTAGFISYNILHKKAEIGFALSKEYWNNGLMTEAVKKVIECGFTRFLLNKIVATCHIENFGSMRVLEKVGMKYEGTLRDEIFIKNHFVDLKTYSILKKDFLKF